MNESAPRWPGTKGGPGLDFSPYRTSAGGAITKPGNTKNKRINAKQQAAKQAAAKAGEDAQAKTAEQAKEQEQPEKTEQSQPATQQQGKQAKPQDPATQGEVKEDQGKAEQTPAPAKQAQPHKQEQGKDPAQGQVKAPAQQAKAPAQGQAKQGQGQGPAAQGQAAGQAQAKASVRAQGKPQEKEKADTKPQAQDKPQPQGKVQEKEKQAPAPAGEEPAKQEQAATTAKTQPKPDFKISPAQVNRAEKARQEWEATPVATPLAPPSAPAAGSGAAGATAPTVVKIPTKSQAPEGDTEHKRTTRRTRKARLRLARVDPWSVMKTTFLFAIAFGVMMWVVTAVVWSVLASSGALGSINETINKVLGDAENPFDITQIVSVQRVLGFAAVVAVIDVVIITAVSTLMAFLYNIAATVMGGLEVTLAED